MPRNFPNFAVGTRKNNSSMCLVTNKTKPIKAKKDIYVIKELNERNGKYFAPSQGTEYKLNEVMEAGGSDNSTVKATSKREIGGGYIHAHTTATGDNKHGFVAIIPAGTEFYIDDDFENVCAKKLVVTDEKVDDGGKVSLPENYRNLAEAVLEAYLDDETKVGYYVMLDRSLVSPYDLAETDKPIAIVVKYDKETGERLAWALEQKELKWCTDVDKHSKTSIRVAWTPDRAEAIACKDTAKCMTAIREDEGYQKSPEDFPAFKYVDEFKTEGTKAGDWNMDAPGVLFDVSMDGMTVANAAMLYTGVGTLIYGWYWSSAENSQGYAWGCGTAYAYLYGYSGKWSSNYVRPSLALAASVSTQTTPRKRSLLSRLLGREKP